MNDDDHDLDDGPAIPAWAHLVARSPEATPPWVPAKGDVIDGKIVVGERIGQGALGTVYRAHQSAPLDRPVALKVMRVAGESGTFEAEARATARVRHPNVVTLFDFGREKDTPYLVLELLDGQTLGDRAKAGEISLPSALAIGADIAAAVAAAHLQDVTHRDLSPHNVFCTTDGQIKVLDFGFAALERALRTQRSTRAGSAKELHRPAGGTPGFVDPHQIDGTDAPRVSDLFGLGALLFWLVAGRPPWAGDTLEAYLAGTRAGPPPHLRDLAPSAPRDLDDLVASLLDGDPTKRPSAEEARDRLRELRRQIDARLAPGQRRRRATPVVTDPFRPLQTFATGDAELFFGRRREIEDLAALVRAHRLVVLEGSSGTGKSSLLQAGLRPALDAEMLWLDVAPATEPTPEPVTLLEECIRAALGPSNAALHGAEPEALLLALAARESRPVLVVLDQFEEMFQRRSREEIRRAATALARVLRRATQNAAPIHVLVSVRADHFGHLRHLQSELPGIFDTGVRLEPLGDDATRQAIEMPFELAGFELPPGLVERMRKDLAEEGQVSPVELQLVCQALYERASTSGARSVSEEAYRKLGGAGQVLTEHLARAERTWSAETLSAVWPILHRLVAKEGTRTPPRDAKALAEETGLRESAVESALTCLTVARIVQPQERKQDDEPVRYRIGHDRMGRAVWERMSAEHRRGVTARERIQVEMPREPKDAVGRALWFLKTMPADTRAELLRWHAEGAAAASEAERAFLKRLAVWEKRRRRWPRIGAAAGVVLLAGLVAYALVQRQQLREEQARTAEANAEREMDHDPGKALAWITRAAELRGGFENEDERYYHQHWLLAQEAWRAGAGWEVATHGGKEVRWVGFSPSESDIMKVTKKPCPDCWPHKKRLVSVGTDGVVRVVDLATRERVELPEPVQEGFVTGALSPDGRWVAAAGQDGRVYVWDLTSRTRTVLLAGEVRGAVAGLTVSPEGGWLAAGYQDGGIQVWQIVPPSSEGTGSLSFRYGRIFSGHKVGIKDLAFSPEGQRLLSVDESGQVRSTLLPTREDEWLGEPSDARTGNGVAFSPDGAWFGAAVGWQVLLFDAADISLTPRRLEPRAREITRLAFVQWDGHDGVILGTIEGEVSQWRHVGQDWQRLRKIHSHDGPVSHLLAHGDHVLTAGVDGRVFVGEAGTLTERLFRGHEGRVAALAESPDGDLVASGGLDGHVRLWARRGGTVSAWGTGGQVQSLFAPRPATLVVAGLKSGEQVVWKDGGSTRVAEAARGGSMWDVCGWSDGRIASAVADGTVEVTSVDDAPPLRRSDLASASLLCLPDGRLVSGGETEIRTWDLRNNSITTVGSHGGPVSSLALTPGGALVSGSYDGTVALWDLAQRSKLASFSPEGRVMSVAAFGKHEVVVALADGRLVRWNGQTGAQHSIEPPHAGVAGAVAAHPGARLVVSSGEDGLFLRWVDSGLLRELKGHQGGVRAATFTEDGRSILSGGLDYSVRIWPLPPVDRLAFRDWLTVRTPYTIENNEPKPKPLSALPPMDMGAP